MLKESDEVGGLPLAGIKASFQAVVTEGVRLGTGTDTQVSGTESGNGSTHVPPTDFHRDAETLSGRIVFNKRCWTLVCPHAR